MFLPLVSLLIAGQTFGRAGWVQVRVDVPTPAVLQRLEDTDLCLMDCVPHLGTADVAVGPKDWAKLTKGGFTYQGVRSLEDPTNWGARHSTGHARVTDDYRYNYFTDDQIIAFFEQLRAAHSHNITRQAIGTSINGETMWAYRFAPDPSPYGKQPNNIVIEGLIHAREWITGACVMHIGRMVADSLPGTGTYAPMLSGGNHVIWIIPIVNPDGYRYTWATNRFWRKNRRHNSGGSYGVDLNRNFSTGYGLNGGSSSNQSSETYKGTAAFSEPEAKAVRDLILSLPRVGGFIDYHSYAQDVLRAWGYTTTAPPDAAAHEVIGQAVRAEMSNYGATYAEGQCSTLLYIASGVTTDYAYEKKGTPAFAIELRGGGTQGFDLPASEIYVSQDEVWAGFDKYCSLIGQ